MIFVLTIGKYPSLHRYDTLAILLSSSPCAAKMPIAWLLPVKHIEQDWERRMDYQYNANIDFLPIVPQSLWWALLALSDCLFFGYFFHFIAPKSVNCSLSLFCVEFELLRNALCGTPNLILSPQTHSFPNPAKTYLFQHPTPSPKAAKCSGSQGFIRARKQSTTEGEAKRIFDGVKFGFSICALY